MTNVWPLDRNPTAPVQLQSFIFTTWRPNNGEPCGFYCWESVVTMMTHQHNHRKQVPFGRPNTSLIASLNLFYFLAAQFNCFTQILHDVSEGGPNTISTMVPSYLWIWHLASLPLHNVQFAFWIFFSHLHIVGLLL